MAKVTITIEDGLEHVNIEVASDPPFDGPAAKNPNVTTAQILGMELMGKLPDIFEKYKKKDDGVENLSPIEDHPVYAEVARAYGDDPVMMFRASAAVSPKMAQAIMEKACPEYNAFEPGFLGTFPDDCKITLAREYGVCVYVQPGKKKLPPGNKLWAD